MGEGKAQVFGRHLPSYKDQFVWIDAEVGAGDFEANRQVADLAILGLGINGHVAFHEPFVPAEFTFGCVALAKGTCDSLGIPEGTWGVTYGLGHFLEAKKIAIIATGRSKALMVTKILARDRSIPAGWMMDHDDFTLVADEEAFPGGAQDFTVSRAADFNLF